VSTILAVDCCMKLTGVALSVDNCVVDCESNELGRLQARELPLMTKRIISRNNLAFTDIDYIALTNGPGYFTGIRAGAAYATGLAYACGVKIIPVSSLEMLAYGINRDKVLALVYAGKGFVYALCENYLSEGEYSHAQITDWIRENPDVLVISDDPDKIGLKLKAEILTVRPDVKALCEIAAKSKRVNLAVSPLELKISYYRSVI